MHITQGTFSYLPPLSDEQVRAQVQYMIDNGWAVAIEFTDDPHPRNTYWTMWSLPMFDVRDAAAVMFEIAECKSGNRGCYVKVNGFDPSPLRQGQVLSFIVHRPTVDEKGYRMTRAETGGQVIGYALNPYAADQPAGKRYGRNGG
jgi:ribulose-bisphosphate carboxylase small chain